MAYDAEAAVEAKAFVAKIRSETVCARCGRQPIEWHSEKHHTTPHHRVSNMAMRGYPLDVIATEIARCEPLCRSCHMKSDGRAAARNAALAAAARRNITPQLPCAECGRLYKPLRRGLCSTCYERKRWQTRKARPNVEAT